MGTEHKHNYELQRTAPDIKDKGAFTCSEKYNILDIHLKKKLRYFREK